MRKVLTVDDSSNYCTWCVRAQEDNVEHLPAPHHVASRHIASRGHMAIWHRDLLLHGLWYIVRSLLTTISVLCIISLEPSTTVHISHATWLNTEYIYLPMCFYCLDKSPFFQHNIHMYRSILAPIDMHLFYTEIFFTA